MGRAVQALAAVLSLSTAAVIGGVALGGFAGTFLVYIFLLVRCPPALPVTVCSLSAACP